MVISEKNGERKRRKGRARTGSEMEEAEGGEWERVGQVWVGIAFLRVG